MLPEITRFIFSGLAGIPALAVGGSARKILPFSEMSSGVGITTSATSPQTAGVSGVGTLVISRTPAVMSRYFETPVVLSGSGTRS